VPRQMRQALSLVEDIIAEEIREHVKPVRKMAQNPVTVWLPESGHVQLCIPLPLPVHRLDELPDWSPYAKKVKVALDQITPDAKLFVDFYKNASNYLMPANGVRSPQTEVIRQRPNPNRSRYQPRVEYESARRYRPRHQRYRKGRNRH